VSTVVFRLRGVRRRYEGSLTTDCPGAKVDFDKNKKSVDENLNYTDSRGWHQDEQLARTPRFEKLGFGSCPTTWAILIDDAPVSTALFPAPIPHLRAMKLDGLFGAVAKLPELSRIGVALKEQTERVMKM